MKVLIVEDSERLRRSLGEGLRRSGFAVDLVADGEEALAFVEHVDYDVVVLDLMLPKIDGLTVLRRLRATKKKASVLILSARDAVESRIEGLDAGADDYLVKPFSFDELLARLRALARRSAAERSPILTFGTLEIDTVAKSVLLSGRPIELTAMEYGLLELLALRRGRVVGREEILSRLYESAFEPTSNVVEAMVYSLRKKIQPPGTAPVVLTRRGLGYVIEGD